MHKGGKKKKKPENNTEGGQLGEEFGVQGGTAGPITKKRERGLFTRLGEHVKIMNTGKKKTKGGTKKKKH